jgi:hypothetical protein
MCHDGYMIKTAPFRGSDAGSDHQNFPLLLFLSLINSSCSRIPFSSCRCLSLVSSSNRACSFFNSVNSSSNFSCHGYRTKIWKHNAEEPMTKFVREKPRVNSIVTADFATSGVFDSCYWYRRFDSCGQFILSGS